MPCFTAVKDFPPECRLLVPSKKLETNVFAPSIRRFAPLSLTLVALGLSACGTTSSGPAQRIAVVEEDTQGTSTVNISSLRSEEHTSELQSRQYLVCRLLLEKKKHYISSSLPLTRLTSR